MVALLKIAKNNIFLLLILAGKLLTAKPINCFEIKKTLFHQKSFINVSNHIKTSRPIGLSVILENKLTQQKQQFIVMRHNINFSNFKDNTLNAIQVSLLIKTLFNDGNNQKSYTFLTELLHLPENKNNNLLQEEILKFYSIRKERKQLKKQYYNQIGLIYTLITKKRLNTSHLN